MSTMTVVTFLGLSVSPQMICNVTQSQDSVMIESNQCTLTGSKYVEDLNGCFRLNIRTIFNWIDEPVAKSILSKSEIFVEVDPPKPFKYFGKRVLENAGTLAMSIALSQIENSFVQSLAQDYNR